MNEEKQIEEMAKVICRRFHATDDVTSRDLARAVYKAGYCKQRESPWRDPVTDPPEEFESVLGFMTDAGDLPPVRECYRVGGVFFFPALKDRHPVSHWMPLPEPPMMKGGME